MATTDISGILQSTQAFLAAYKAGMARQAQTPALTPDQLLYQAIIANTGTPATDQTGFSYGLSPQDALFANSLMSLSPLDAVALVSTYATPQNLLPAGFTSAPGVSADVYQGNFLGTITPQNAVNIVHSLAAPFV